MELPKPTKNRVIIKRDPTDDSVTEVNGIFLYADIMTDLWRKNELNE